MILVLTYHRIVGDSGAIRQFFDVSADELDWHVRLVKEVWGEGASPRMLLESTPGRDEERQGFLITFDDGTEDHYHRAAPVLERNGVRGVFFVNTSLLGTDGYLTMQQCRELQARGHAIESHAHEHKKLTELLEEDLRRQLSGSRRLLRESGLGQWNFLAVPGGYFSDVVLRAAKDEGYQCLRTLEWGYNRTMVPLRIESITVNRRTTGWWFGPLISPRLESAKKLFYRAKELVKGGRLQSFYFGLRSPGESR